MHARALALAMLAVVSLMPGTASAAASIREWQETSQTAAFQTYNTVWDSAGQYVPGTYTDIFVATDSVIPDPVGSPVSDGVNFMIIYSQFSPPNPVVDFYYWSNWAPELGSGMVSINEELTSTRIVATIPAGGISPSWEGLRSVTFTVDLTCSVSAPMKTEAVARSYGEPSESRTVWKYVNRARRGGDCTGSILLDGVPVVVDNATLRRAEAVTQRRYYREVTP